MNAIDSGYLIASIDRTDHLHQRARRWAAVLEHDYLVVHDYVLTEVYAYFSHPRTRVLADRSIEQILQRNNVELIIVDRPLLNAGRSLYRNRPDKECPSPTASPSC